MSFSGIQRGARPLALHAREAIEKQSHRTVSTLFHGRSVAIARPALGLPLSTTVLNSTNLGRPRFQNNEGSWNWKKQFTYTAAGVGVISVALVLDEVFHSPEAEKIVSILQNKNITLKEFLELYPLELDKVNSVKMEAFWELLHSSKYRTRIIDLMFESPENPLETLISYKLFRANEGYNQPHDILITPHILKALTAKVSNEQIKNGNGEYVHTLNRWIESVDRLIHSRKTHGGYCIEGVDPYDFGAIYTKEMLKQNVIQDLCLNDEWSEVRAGGVLSFYFITNLLANSGEHKTLVNMFKNTHQTKLPRGILECLAMETLDFYGLQINQKPKWEQVIGKILDLFPTYEDLQEFADRTQDFHLAVLLAERRKLNLTKGFWKSDFIELAKSHNAYFNTKQELSFAWALKLKIPMLQLSMLGERDMSIPPEAWANYFVSLENFETCKEAFHALAPIMIGHGYSYEDGSLKLTSVLKALSRKYGRVFEKEIIDSVMSILKKQDVDKIQDPSTIKCSYTVRPSEPQATLQQWKDLNALFLGTLLVKRKSGLNLKKIADGFLKICRDAPANERDNLIYKLTAFYGSSSLRYGDGFYDKGDFLNRIFEKLSDEEKNALLVAWNDDLEKISLIDDLVNEYRLKKEFRDVLPEDQKVLSKNSFESNPFSRVASVATFGGRRKGFRSIEQMMRENPDHPEYLLMYMTWKAIIQHNMSAFNDKYSHLYENVYHCPYKKK